MHPFLATPVDVYDAPHDHSFLHPDERREALLRSGRMRPRLAGPDRGIAAALQRDFGLRRKRRDIEQPQLVIVGVHHPPALVGMPDTVREPEQTVWRARLLSAFSIQQQHRMIAARRHRDVAVRRDREMVSPVDGLACLLRLRADAFQHLAACGLDYGPIGDAAH